VYHLLTNPAAAMASHAGFVLYRGGPLSAPDFENE